MIHNGTAVDQRFAIVEHQRRDAPEGIAGADLLSIAEPRNLALLEIDAVGP